MRPTSDGAFGIWHSCRNESARLAPLFRIRRTTRPCPEIGARYLTTQCWTVAFVKAEEGVFLPPPFPASGQSYLQNSLHSSEETSSLGVMDTDRIADWHTGCHGDVAKQGGRADERRESLALFLFWEVRVGKKDFQGQLRSCS